MAIGTARPAANSTAAGKVREPSWARNRRSKAHTAAAALNAAAPYRPTTAPSAGNSTEYGSA